MFSSSETIPGVGGSSRQLIYFATEQNLWEFDDPYQVGEAEESYLKQIGGLKLLPRKLTWNLQITHLERKMIFQTSMIMFHVNQGCKWSYSPAGC